MVQKVDVLLVLQLRLGVSLCYQKEFLVSLACVIVVESLVLDFPKDFPNSKMLKSTDKENHKQDQSQNRCAILPSQGIVSKEGLQIDK